MASAIASRPGGLGGGDAPRSPVGIAPEPEAIGSLRRDPHWGPRKPARSADGRAPTRRCLRPGRPHRLRAEGFVRFDLRRRRVAARNPGRCRVRAVTAPNPVRCRLRRAGSAPSRRTLRPQADRQDATAVSFWPASSRPGPTRSRGGRCGSSNPVSLAGHPLGQRGTLRAGTGRAHCLACLGRLASRRDRARQRSSRASRPAETDGTRLACSGP